MNLKIATGTKRLYQHLLVRIGITIIITVSQPMQDHLQAATALPPDQCGPAGMGHRKTDSTGLPLTDVTMKRLIWLPAPMKGYTGDKTS